MALTPDSAVHAQQILAGTVGRHAGHDFEDEVAEKINGLKLSEIQGLPNARHVFTGRPELLLTAYVLARLTLKDVSRISAVSAGALATSEKMRSPVIIDGVPIKKCKSDLILSIESKEGVLNLGISVKQCSNDKPTNAQLYFSTAVAFSGLLRNNGVTVTKFAEDSLREFCGDSGYRPVDRSIKGNGVHPERYFWEQTEATGRTEWE